MLLDDPEAPTTINRKFKYGPLTGGKVKGSVTIDAGSIESTDPTVSADEAAAAPARRQASNWLVASPNRSATGNPLAVMGPQLGYYYPEIVQQMDLKGPGIKSSGRGVPGLAMYSLIGRTQDYAWSLTSAGHDVRDVYAEELCNPDGSTPTRESTHYLYKGECRPLEVFNAGLLNGDPVIYDRSVHGPVFATATVERQAVRDGAQAVDLRPRRAEPRRPARHDRGQGEDGREVLEDREQLRLHLQLGVRLAREDRVLQLRPACPSGPRASTADCRRSAPASTSGRASSVARSTPTRSAARTACS